MGMHLRSIAWVFMSLAMISCTALKKPTAVDDPLSGMDAYKAAGGRVGGFASEVAANADVSVTIEPGASGIASDDEIVWAPEDENAPMPGGLEELWKSPDKKSWHVSYTEAARLSRHSGKPMLIWFTDTAHSPLCRRLSDELFSNQGFDAWSKKRIVRLRVDNAIPHKEKRGDLGARKRKYIDSLKRRYKVMGYPTVLVLSPRGAVVERYRGYKKESADYYWGRIKAAVDKAEDDYGAWREKLEKKGYRVWTSRDGRKTFARLGRYYKGKVTLIDPDGNKGRTTFRKLSDADQTWIMLEKKRYEKKRKS